MGRRARLAIHVLGPFRVEVDAVEVPVSARKNRTLLAELALARDNALTREEIVARLWPESDDDRARDSLRHALWRLRNELGPAGELLESRGDDLRLADDVTVDVQEFERLAASDRPQDTAKAIDLYRGDLSRELDGPDAEAERTRLRGLLADAGHRSGELRLAANDTAGAIAIARAVLRADPFREDVVRILLRAHAQTGDGAALTAEYRRFGGLLRAELGVDPNGDTRALYARLMFAGQQPAAPKEIRRPRPPATSTLVGRQAEHRRLIELLTDVIDGRGRALLLLGDAGAGKTALVAETTRIARDHGFTVMAARAAGAEGRLAFQTWRDALRPFAESAAALPVPWPNVLSALVAVDMGDASAGIVSPEFERARLFEGVARLVSSLAAAAPVLVAIDDLQWMDADSVQLFHYLIRTLRGDRVAFIGAARSAEAQAARAIAETRVQLRSAALLDELELTSLGAEAVGELLRRSGVSAGTTSWLAARVATWTAGNPLFVLEATTALTELGALRASANGLEWSGAPPAEGEPLAAALPTGVRQTLLARIGSLPTDTRHMLNIAAAVGTTFVPDVLAMATDRDELAVLETLSPALAANLLREDSLDGRPALAFTHDLMREATYQDMPSVLRAAIHRRVATALETKGAPSAVLAYHFTAASDPERATTHWIAAAAQAERAFAHDEALRAYRAALSTIPAADRERRMRTLELAGDVHLRRGAVGDAIDAYDEAMVACNVAEVEHCARLGVKIAVACGRHYGQHPHAFEFARSGVAFFEAARPESADMADALLALMAMQYQRGDTTAVRRTGEHLRSLCRRLDLPREEAGALTLETWARWLDGDVVATPAEVDVTRLTERLGDDEEVSHVLACVGRAANRSGDFTRGLEIGRMVEQIALRVGSTRTEDIALEITLGALVNLGRWQEAIEVTHRGEGQRIPVEDVHDRLIARGTAQAMSGDLAAARDTARALAGRFAKEPPRPNPLHQSTRNEVMRVYLLAGLPELFPSWEENAAARPRCLSCQHNWLTITGAAHAVYGDRDEALRCADELEAMIDRSGYAAAAGYPWLMRALVHGARGDAAHASAARAEAVRRFEATGNALGVGALLRLTDLSMPLSTVRS
ncbi:MAG TPA: AAA family ATPase [Candidatus Limnocylindria bacterium]|nr:AAA family ATPase [Candidatus Limnocylindria bacterium]